MTICTGSTFAPRMSRVSILALVSLFLLIMDLASAADLTVPDKYPTIKAAVEAATAGDTVRILAGTYDGPIPFKEGITLEGENRDRVIIRGPAMAGPLLDIEKCASGVVRKITFEHTGAPEDFKEQPDAPPTVRIAASAIELSDCVVHGSAASGIIIHHGGTPVIRDCVSRNNVRNGLGVSDEGTAPTSRRTSAPRTVAAFSTPARRRARHAKISSRRTAGLASWSILNPNPYWPATPVRRTLGVVSITGGTHPDGRRVTPVSRTAPVGLASKTLAHIRIYRATFCKTTPCTAFGLGREPT